MDYSEIIAQSELAEGLDEDSVGKLAQIAKTCRFSKGDLIIKEGEATSAIYVIYEGWVSIEILRFPYDTGTQRLRLLKNKGIVGEFSFIDRSKRSANVVAQEDLDCLMRKSDELEDIIKHDYKLGYSIMFNLAKLLCGRIRTTNLELRNQLIW